MSALLAKAAFLLTCVVLLGRPDGVRAAGESVGLPQRKSGEPVEKLGENRFRIGQIRIDTAKREVAVSGTVNGVNVLEFVANTKNGGKAYESALTLDTDGVTFNTALILIGLDKANAVPSKRHFDPDPPQGDPVEIWVEWEKKGGKERVRAEKLLYDKRTGKTFPEGPWVYTGSVFVEGRYLSDVDGVLIGFVHTPAPVIENPSSTGVGFYGSIVFNPELGLERGSPVTVVVRALPREPSGAGKPSAAGLGDAAAQPTPEAGAKVDSLTKAADPAERTSE